MPKSTFASLSDIDDAYLTPNDDESREDCKRRKANKLQAKSRWNILHRAAIRSEQPLTECILNATRMAVHRQQMSPEERRASCSRHTLQVANQHAVQSGPARQRARETNNAQHRARASQGSGVL
ncbi:hypothetical protein PHYSODRAFT_306382 [Phytophthora sojae]|uniref:Uncharacterized protein n=1 Tax=Phytophthora sojae (strain P6497) TaxID=1094619 RepID=G5A9B8_PHYSP|nr:hypothetical protein PHYSODRAFT_306382 [Phytophthora sojae]EGZ08494.1 hypothetical protein PHYSODRAFT_306382 [Phytophthora sojae]|eukprot:XP_009536666.1 hypothetical protein PHYSODRAFT_306382 [Phytophthora sojae]